MTDMVITRALVRGKTYYRVSAGGLQQSAAASMCASVKASGHGCIAWAITANANEWLHATRTLDLVVILTNDPLLGGHVGCSENCHERIVC
jgi:hypothetical protein